MIKEKTVDLENIDEVNNNLSIFIAKNIKFQYSLEAEQFLQNVYEITLHWSFYHYQDKIIDIIKFQVFVNALVINMTSNGLTFAKLQYHIENYIKEQENASTID